MFGVEMGQTVIDPALFIRKVLYAVKEVERALEITSCQRRHLQDTIHSWLKCPRYMSADSRTDRGSADAGAGTASRAQAW